MRSSFSLRFIEWRSDVSQGFGGGSCDIAVNVKRFPSIASNENSKVEVGRGTGTPYQILLSSQFKLQTNSADASSIGNQVSYR